MGTVQRVQRVEDFQTHPDRYRHWKLAVDGAIATLTLDIDEENGLRPDDYELKQNSYDLGVDIELCDAVQRLRFEHPEVRSLVFTSGQPKVFCAGANIKMLASSTHGFKVNFCKYTNETRLSLEDASELSGLKSIAALNGTAAGGGYELALACDEIWLIDDGSSVVSLPEVPLLGVLPGTGGLTRLVDKRRVRRDLADLFCTKAEGYRTKESKRYGLIDGALSRSKWDAGIAERAAAVAAGSPARSSQGVELPRVDVEIGDAGSRVYKYVTLEVDTSGRQAKLTVRAPESVPPEGAVALRDAGCEAWVIRAYRELDDALLHLRFNHDTVGLVLLHTRGDAAAVLAHDAALEACGDDWFASEIRYLQARVLRRLDNTAKSLFAIIDEGSCFAGSLFELSVSADRSYMLEDDDGNVRIQVTGASDGRYPMTTGLSRLQCRFLGEPERIDDALAAGEALDSADAFDAGLVTMALDDIDFEDEIRIAVEERVSLSPDALTGMEQNLRFAGSEGCDSKIFGRLSAWQNWIFQRPNAVGDEGALTLYGHPTRPRFDWRRT